MKLGVWQIINRTLTLAPEFLSSDGIKVAGLKGPARGS